MENNRDYYVSYKFYDGAGRRLSIFCIPGYRTMEENDMLPETVLYIYILPCSKKDTFSKLRAKMLFLRYRTYKNEGLKCPDVHPIEIQVDVINEKPKWTFLHWCEKNYYKYQRTIMAVEAQMLWRGEERHPNSKMVNTEFIPVLDADAIPHDQSEN